MKKILGIFGIVAACAACCAIPFLPALAGAAFASGVGVAVGMDVVVCGAVLLLAIGGFFWLRLRESARCGSASSQGPACSNKVFDKAAPASKKKCC